MQLHPNVCATQDVLVLTSSGHRVVPPVTYSELVRVTGPTPTVVA